MPKISSSYYQDYLVVVEADFGSALDSTDQVGFLKFNPEFCPNEYDQNSFRVLSVGHSQVELRNLSYFFKFWFVGSPY